MKNSNSLTSLQVTFIFFVLLLSFTIRTMGIMERSLWSDEVVVFNYISDNLLYDIKKMVIEDIHPPFYYLLQRVTLGFFGSSPLSLRLVSLISGVISVLLLFFIGKRLFGFRGGMAASLFLALSPFNIFYSQQARMYSLLVAIALFSIFFLIKYERDEKYSLIGFLISITLGLYTYYPFALFIASIFIYSIIFMKKEKFVKLTITILIAFLLLSPTILYILSSKLGSENAVNKFLNTEFSTQSFGIINKTIASFTLESDIEWVKLLILISFMPVFILLSKDLNERYGSFLIWLLIFIPPLLLFFSVICLPILDTPQST